MIVMTANSIDKNVGVYYRMHTRPTPDPHIHDGFHEIMILLQGGLTHTCESQRTRMQPGDLFFLPNESSHTLSEQTEDTLMLNLCITLSTFEQAIQFLHLSNIPATPVFSQTEQAVVDYLLWNHEQLTLTTQSAGQTAIIRNTLALLLPYCCENQAELDWFEALLVQMRRQENFQAGVHKMQALAFCSPSHLSRVCKARTGLTPTEYVDQLRIQYACNLLKHMEYDIQEICMECGYNNLSYFYRRFVQTTGLTPKQYKETHYLYIQPRL